MTYNLASPVPEISTASNVIYGLQNATGFIMWEDGSSVVHLGAWFGGQVSPLVMHYLNTDTDAHALVSCPAINLDGPGNYTDACYSSVHDKLVWSSTTGDGTTPNYIAVFDPATQTNTLIRQGNSDTPLWWATQQMTEGADNLVYVISLQINNKHVYRFNPTTGAASWTDMGAPLAGVILDGDSQYCGVCADASYIYCVIGDNDSYMHLFVRPVGEGSWTEYTSGDFATDCNYNTYEGDHLTQPLKDTSGNWYVKRKASGGTEHLYALTGGAPVLNDSIDEGGAISQIILTFGCACTPTYDVSSDYEFFASYGIDFNASLVCPISGTNLSIIYYGDHATWNYPTDGYSTSSLSYTGDYYAQYVGTISAADNANIYAYSIGYNGGNACNYLTGVRSLPGRFIAPSSIYRQMYVPAEFSPLSVPEVYYCGYPGMWWRVTPSSGWSPVRLDTLSSLPHMSYRTQMDYDADGCIWNLANKLGAGGGGDWGQLAKYTPGTPGSIEDIFFTTWTTDNNYVGYYLCASNNRSKILVSGQSGAGPVNSIWVLTASTGAVEGSVEVGDAKAYMVELSNDRVLVVTSSAGTDNPNTVGIFKPSDRSWIVALQSTGVAGNNFDEADGTTTRRFYRLICGPDGYGWIYKDTQKIYRIHPTTCTYEEVKDTSGYSGHLSWAGNNTDLIISRVSSGTTVLKYLPGLLDLTGRLIGGVENVAKFNAVTQMAKFNGVTL